MRKYAFRKMTHADFMSRLERVDPHYIRHGSGLTKNRVIERPFLSLVGGFAWAYVVISVARNREYIESSLLQGSLPVQFHDHIFATLAVLLAVSTVFLMLHVLRFAARRNTVARKNSGRVLAGALMAGTLVYTPASVFELGLGLLDENSRSLIVAAGEGAKNAGVSFSSVSFVSSQGSF